MVNTNHSPHGQEQFIRPKRPFNERHTVGKHEQVLEARENCASPLPAPPSANTQSLGFRPSSSISTSRSPFIPLKTPPVSRPTSFDKTYRMSATGPFGADQQDQGCLFMSAASRLCHPDLHGIDPFPKDPVMSDPREKQEPSSRSLGVAPGTLVTLPELSFHAFLEVLRGCSVDEELLNYPSMSYWDKSSEFGNDKGSTNSARSSVDSAYCSMPSPDVFAESAKSHRIRESEDLFDLITQMEDKDQTVTETGYWTTPVKLPALEPSMDQPRTHHTALKSEDMATDAPLSDIGEESIGGMDSDAEEYSRSPSPWQTAYDLDTDQWLIRYFIRDLGDQIPSSQTSSTSSPQNPEGNSPATDSIEGVVSHAPEPGSGPSPAAKTWYPGGNLSGINDNRKRARNPSDPTRDSDGGDEQDPNAKRLKPATSEGPLLRLRFACPYQRVDTADSPFCCAPSNKNPEGGAETFSHIK